MKTTRTDELFVNNASINNSGTVNIPAGQTYNINGVPISGTGDVVGPGASTDNAVPRFDSTTGKLIQNSLMTVSDAGTSNIPSGQNYNVGGSPVGLFMHKTHLSSAQILTGFSVPIDSGITNPGAGKYIKPIKADINYTQGGTPFDGGSFTIFYVTGSNKNLFISSENVTDGESFFQPFRDASTFSGNTLVVNSPLYVGLTEDSTVGNGSADIYIFYQIVTL